jgi:DNA-binding LytR/AlgR family response regulator
MPDRRSRRSCEKVQHETPLRRQNNRSTAKPTAQPLDRPEYTRDMTPIPDRILLHITEDRRIPVDPHDIFFVETDEDDTRIRTRHAEALSDVRELAEMLPLLEVHGFYRVNRSQVANLRRIREIRRDSDGGWELKLDPPVNRVLPISRRRAAGLWDAFGE